MTNLQIENCLKDYPATVCCADRLPSHVGVRPRTFIVNTDTCDRGGMDDLMSTAAKDQRINDLFTEGSHHRNLTVIALNQNLYFAKPPPPPLTPSPPLPPPPPPPQVVLQHLFTLMAAVVAEVVAMVVVVTMVVVAEVNIHDCLYVYIGDDGGPTRSSSIRTRVTVAEVTGWHFTFPSWDSSNLSIRWETHRKRITAVSPTPTDRNTTTVRLKSNPTTPTPLDCIVCTTSNGDIEERGHNFKI